MKSRRFKHNAARAHSIVCRRFTEIETIYRSYQDLLCKNNCHPERALFAQREPGLSEAEGDLGKPREASRFLRRITRVFGSLPLFTSPDPSALPEAKPAWQT
jgi:hypothetical protein